MTRQEYLDWKEHNPEEWEQAYKEVVENFEEEKAKHKNLDDVMYRAASRDPDQREFTYRRIEQALAHKNDCCDMLVQMQKQYIDFKKKIGKTE